MPSDETEQLLTEIGQLLSEEPDYKLKDTLLYAELDANCVSSSVFSDLGEYILYRDTDLRLDYALLDLWEAQESDKRWTEIEYVVRGREFQASFTYPDEIDSNEDPLERRTRVVERYFGRKPITYPPPPDDATELKP